MPFALLALSCQGPRAITYLAAMLNRCLNNELQHCPEFPLPFIVVLSVDISLSQPPSVYLSLSLSLSIFWLRARGFRRLVLQPKPGRL